MSDAGGPEHKRARISDVGRIAGVSSRTVRRVLQGSPRVASATRERVERALKEMEYRPHLLARGLRLKRTNLIGVVTPSIRLEVLSSKLAAMEEEAWKRGYRVILGVAHTPEAIERHMEDFLHLCDAVVIIGDWVEAISPRSVQRLMASGIPYVAADESTLPENAVAIDRGGGVRHALELLHERYRYYTYLSDPVSERIDPRGVAFGDTLTGLGKASAMRVGHGSSAFPETGYGWGDRIAAELPHLVCCQNDRIATGLVKRLMELGVAVPEDVGIVGFDDDAYGPYAARAITTIAQPVEELARATLEMVELQVGGVSRVPSRLLRTTFIPRASTP